MTKAATLTDIGAFWASWLGCAREDLSRPGVWVTPCSETPPHRQVFLFRRRRACIVSVGGPPDGGALLTEVETIVAGHPVERIFRGDFWTDCLGGRVAHIGVITHPGHRGKGHGKAVVAEVSRDALANGLTLQYRTLAANAPSVAIARALGFQHYADTIAVRSRDS